MPNYLNLVFSTFKVFIIDIKLLIIIKKIIKKYIKLKKN